MPFVGRNMSPDSRWWQAEDETELAAAVVSTAQFVDQVTSARRTRILESYALYGDESAIPEASIEMTQTPVTRNILALAVDTVLAEVTQTRPRPMFVTIGGDWFEQERARKLSYHYDAVYDEHNVRGLAEQITRDAIISGLGIVRPRINPKDGKSVLIERIFPGNLLVDDRGAVDVLPRDFFVRHLVNKWHLAELYPEQAADIESAARVSPEAWFADGARSTDVIEVIEAFHLPSRADGSDGRHAVAIAECVLLDEPYTFDEPPFVFIRAIRPLRGFWGISLVQRAAPTQWELNRVLSRYNEALRRNATTRYWVQRGSRVAQGHIGNKVGTIVYYDGERPYQETPLIMHQQIVDYMDRAEARIFKLMGASELAATSLKPAGLNSGRALTVYNDVQSRRFIHLERQYEGIFVDLARQLVRLEKQIAKEHPDYKILVRDKLRTAELDWSKVNLDDDAYRVRIFPASAFPNDPAAKIEMLQEMVRDGVIDHQSFYELALDVPDLESVRNRIVAPLELLHQRFAVMLEEDEYRSPDPYMNFALAIRECALAIQRAELQGVPEERVDHLRRFMTDVVAQQNGAQASAPAAPPGPGGMPVDALGPVPPGPLPPGIAIPGGPPGAPMPMPPGPPMPMPMPGMPMPGMPPGGMPGMPPMM